MDYFPNEQAMLWFHEAVWPKLRSRRPGLALRIVGADPPRSIRRLGGRDGIEVTGFVPDVRPHLRPAAASVAPLRIARGMQNKVLECMAMGIPTVASERVAAGLGLDAGSPVRVASTPDEYVDELLAIVENGALRTRLSKASRACAERDFSWAGAMRRLDRVIAACLARRAARAVDEMAGDAPRAV
jgi:hypothetical protein